MSDIRAEVIEAVRRAFQRADTMDVNGDSVAQAIRDLPQGTFADEAATSDRGEVIQRIRQDSHWRGTPGHGLFR